MWDFEIFLYVVKYDYKLQFVSKQFTYWLILNSKGIELTKDRKPTATIYWKPNLMRKRGQSNWPWPHQLGNKFAKIIGNIISLEKWETFFNLIYLSAVWLQIRQNWCILLLDFFSHFSKEIISYFVNLLPSWQG